MKGIIYCWTSPSGKKYVGKDLYDVRKRQFLNSKENYTSGNSKIDNARRKYGVESFTYEILKEILADSKEELNKQLCYWEMYYIDKLDTYNNGYNSTKGGEGTLGKIVSEENKALFAKLAKERFTGTTFTDEHKQKIGQALKGRTYTEDTIKKMSIAASKRTKDKNPMYGKHHTEETKAKLGRSIIQYDLNNNFIAEYPSITKAGELLGINKVMISRVLNGSQRQTHSYIFKYKE